jgi:hypothetical protein
LKDLGAKVVERHQEEVQSQRLKHQRKEEEQRFELEDIKR